MKAFDFFSNQYLLEIKKNVKMEFVGYIEEIRHEFNSPSAISSLPKLFVNEIKKILSSEELKSYNDLKYYWANLLEKYLELKDYHDDKEEDLIFSFWEKGPFSEAFLDKIEAGESITSSSSALLPFLEENIISFFYIQISHGGKKFSSPLFYALIPEIGDYPSRIFLNNNTQILKIDLKTSDSTFISLSSISSNRKFIDLIFNNKIETLSITNDSPFSLSSKENLNICYSFEISSEKETVINQNILNSLKLIKKVSPNLSRIFFHFTRTIVPINEKGIVSYSMQDLPGYSSINVCERDHIDMLDDLLHENGHHYLNMILNQEDLIVEDDEKIYYSPWRKSLRPVRGIYHACFTFFWALKLFDDLLIYIEKNPKQTDFSAKDQIKISQRFLEEYAMLTYCYLDLNHAFESGKILPSGMNLINHIYYLIEEMSERNTKRKKSFHSLFPLENKEVETLYQRLKEKRNHYNL